MDSHHSLQWGAVESLCVYAPVSNANGYLHNVLNTKGGNHKYNMPRLKTNSDFDKNLGIIFRRHRINNGFSRKALGELIGVTLQQIQKYETGANHIPLQILIKVATILKMEDPCAIVRQAWGNSPMPNKDNQEKDRQLQLIYQIVNELPNEKIDMVKKFVSLL